MPNRISRRINESHDCLNVLSLFRTFISAYHLWRITGDSADEEIIRVALPAKSTSSAWPIYRNGSSNWRASGNNVLHGQAAERFTDVSKLEQSNKARDSKRKCPILRRIGQRGYLSTLLSRSMNTKLERTSKSPLRNPFLRPDAKRAANRGNLFTSITPRHHANEQASPKISVICPNAIRKDRHTRQHRKSPNPQQTAAICRNPRQTTKNSRKLPQTATKRHKQKQPAAIRRNPRQVAAIRRNPRRVAASRRKSPQSAASRRLIQSNPIQSNPKPKPIHALGARAGDSGGGDDPPMTG